MNCEWSGSDLIWGTSPELPVAAWGRPWKTLVRTICIWAEAPEYKSENAAVVVDFLGVWFSDWDGGSSSLWGGWLNRCVFLRVDGRSVGAVGWHITRSVIDRSFFNFTTPQPPLTLHSVGWDMTGRFRVANQEERGNKQPCSTSKRPY
jgi:hypothetical protein